MGTGRRRSPPVVVEQLFIACVLFVQLANTAIPALPMLAALPVATWLVVSEHPAFRPLLRLLLVLGLLMLLAASLVMLASIWVDALSQYNRVVQTFGGIGGTVAIVSWLGSVFAPPLSRAEFEQAMAKQTEAIAALTDAVNSNNEAVIVQLSELNQQVSTLPERIAALINERDARVVTHVQPDDVED